MSVTTAKYISGDEVVLKGCDTVLDVKVQIAKMKKRLFQEVTVLDERHNPYDDDTALPPSRVNIVLCEQVMFDLSDEKWADTMVEYARRKDVEAVKRTIEVLLAQREAKKIPNTNEALYRICGHALYMFADTEETVSMDCARVLLDAGADVDWMSADSETPLQMAAFRGHEKLVDALLEVDAEIDATNDEEQCALWSAIHAGYEDIALRLIEKECDVNIATEQGRTALHEASVQGITGLVTALLEAGAKVNEASEDRATPLFLAAEKGEIEVVNLLLKAEGIQVDVEDKGGNTALLVAAKGGYEHIVEALLDAGADIDHANKKDETAVDLAHQGAHAGVIVMLE